MLAEVVDFMLGWSCAIESVGGQPNGHVFINVGFTSKNDRKVRLLNPKRGTLISAIMENKN
jgi:hypothetical protein